MSDEVEISVGPLRRPTWSTYGKDFANMLKAFMGSNYLTIAFAFSQTGLILGLSGVLLIASLTAHCCNLIVKCKYHAIEQILQKRKNGGGVQSGRKASEGSSCTGMEESLERSVQYEDDTSTRRKRLVRKLEYGHVGYLCYGKVGVALVNIPIIITQYGFCIAYYIFVGNTIQSIFPLYNCSIPVSNGSLLFHENTEHCYHVKNINSLQTEPWYVANLTDPMPVGVAFQTRNLSAPSPTLDGEDLFTFMSTTPSSIGGLNTTSTTPWTGLTRWILTRGENVPDLRLLVLSPALVFIFVSLVRDLRMLGWISLMANTAIMVGCGEVLYFLIHGFVVSDSFVWVDWAGIPIFFGMVTSSFEGIGTIMPIEGSMEGNRHNFTKYLFGAVFILASILSCFGTLGYIHYGSGVEQMVNANIPNGNALNVFVNVSLCIGVVLTFPLMLFPVAELAEGFFCAPKSCVCGSRDDTDSENTEGEAQSLLPKSHTPTDIPRWKRYILRIVLVLVAAGIAVLLRNYFAYISAFVGALGSTMLAYILPCLFHLKLCWGRLPLAIRVKDIAIIVIGFCLGVAGMFSVVRQVLQ